MNKLPIYAKELLLMGASTTGKFTDGYYFVEERIKTNHANELFAFCEWIDAHIGGAGRGNIDMLFAAYKNPTDRELDKAARALADIIHYNKSLTCN